jgi:hypothetical protein
MEGDKLGKGCLVGLVYLISAAIWVSTGVISYKAINVISFGQAIIWLVGWNLFSSIIILLFVVWFTKAMKI